MTGISAEVGVVTEIKIEEPRKYKVILHNDDKTTFEFVMIVLQTIFFKTFDNAVELTKHVHLSGSAIVGTYTKEIADEKVAETTALARANGFPLTVTHEEE